MTALTTLSKPTSGWLLILLAVAGGIYFARKSKSIPKTIEVGLDAGIIAPANIAVVPGGEYWRIGVIFMEHGSGDRVLRHLRIYDPETGTQITFDQPEKSEGMHTTGPMTDLWVPPGWIIQAAWVEGTTDGTWVARMLYYPERI